ncbi:MAG: cation-translocating P-type ATPase, partial [Gemmataceae bacterium]|nr:cation-translocating P-type ATPase [Gemmataceae bacterium]
FMRSIQQVLKELPADLERGLSEDAVAQSLVKFGPNRLTPLPREPIWKKFLEKFDEPIIKILLAAALLSIVVEVFNQEKLIGGLMFGLIVTVLAVGFAQESLRRWLPSITFGLALVAVGISVLVGHPAYEGFAVMVAVVLATGVAFASEYKSDREFEMLNARKEEIQVKVTRNGGFTTVPLEQVVVGDLVLLEMGDEIPADGRLLKATDLMINQSLMTGESVPVRKRPAAIDETAEGPEQPGCLYRGTQVVDGVGLMMVTEVGDDTMIGQIARRLSAEEGDDAEEPGEETGEARVRKKLTISKQLTPLQHKLSDLADLISKVGYIAAIAIFLALMGRGLVTGGLTASLGGAAKYALDSVVYMVIIIVVAVPEGLPMSVTVSLALAMRKMTRANSLVRQLVACETIGSATVICSDKTGTLTQNKMRVDRAWWDGQLFERDGTNWVRLNSTDSWPRILNGHSPADWIALNCAVNSTAHLEDRGGGKMVPVGNSTEGALLQWLYENGVIYHQLRLQFPPVFQIHFSSERKCMTTVVQYGSRMISLVKGAPETIVGMSHSYVDADGTIRPWTAEMRQKLEAALKHVADQAMRTLAFAFQVLREDMPTSADGVENCREELESGYVFAGFVAIRDPLRDDVKDAVRQCRLAGIEVKMITGDNVHTARAIAQEIGLLDSPDSLILTHDEFDQMSDEQLAEVMPRLRVLARARPMDKLRIVRILQAQDHVVAMTGDGTNDAPALKQADVGLSMGIAGTEVAKEASKIVLLDDAFSTIVKAVHWGRSLYENIQRFIQFQLTINVSALTIAFLGPFLGVRPPFTVLQLLWINVIMDTFAAIALCSEPPRAGLMRMPPKRKNESIVTKSMLSTIFSTAAFFVVVMLVLLWGMKHHQWFRDVQPESAGEEFAPLTYGQTTIFFTVYVLFQMWNQINCRSLTADQSGLHRLFHNRAFLMIASLTLIGQILIVTFTYDIFRVRPLGIVPWLVIFAATSSVLVFAEAARLVRRRLQAKPTTGQKPL